MKQSHSERMKRKAIAIINRDCVPIREQPPLRRMEFSEATVAFSASSGLLDLKSEETRFKNRKISPTIVADVKRFSHQINTDEVFGTHTFQRLEADLFTPAKSRVFGE